MRGDRLEALVDLWLNISQQFDTAGEKKCQAVPQDQTIYQQRNIHPGVSHLRAVFKFFFQRTQTTTKCIALIM